MRKLEGKQSDLKIEVDFAAPAFDLWARGSEHLYSELFAVMSRFGLTVNDINQEVGHPNLGTKAITFSLNQLSTVVRIQLARVEFTCLDLRRITATDGAAVFTGVLDELHKGAPKLQIGVYGATISMHAAVEGQTATQFINARVGQEPNGLGPSTGHAVAYYFGEDGARRKLVVVMDGSAIYPDAIYIRHSIEFDGKAVSYKAYPDVLLKAFHETLRGFDLELIR